jgi:DNA-binding PadR family transcriptional regulator
MARHDLIGLAVLGMLIEQPRHPYEMQRLARDRHKDFATGKGRSFYDAVERLERNGLIEPVETSRAGLRPERTVYRITEMGDEQFDVRLRDLLATPVPEHPTFAAVVSMLGYLPPPDVLRALQERDVALRGVVADLEAQKGALEQELRLPRLLVLELELTLVLLHSELAWLQSLVQDVRSGALTWDTSWLRRRAETAGADGPAIRVVERETSS